MRHLRFALLLCLLILAGSALAISPLPPIDDSNFEAGVRNAFHQRLSQLNQQLSEASEDQRAQLWGDLGQFLHAQKLNYAAQVAYENASELSPEVARWHYLSGVLAADAGEWSRAVDAFEQSLKRDPGYWPALIRLGRAHLSDNTLDEARKAFRRALVRQPDDASVQMSLGDLALAAGDNEEAARHYRLALAVQPDADRIYYQLGLALRNLGQVEQARDALAQRGERYPSSHDPWMAQVQSLNLNSDRFYTRGGELAQSGQYLAAAQQFQRAMELGPDEPAYPAALAQALSAAGEPERAMERIEQARERWPENPELSFQLGIAYEVQGDDTNAARWYEDAFESGEDYPIAGIRLGHTHFRAGNWELAIPLYSRVLNDFGDSPDARFWRGMALVLLNRCGDAMESLKQAVATDPGNPAYARGLARVLATCDAASEEDRRQSLAAAEALHRYRPDAVQVTTLAMAQAANGLYSEAEASQVKAIGAMLGGDPDARLPWYNLLLRRYQAGQAADRPWPEGHPDLTPRLTFQ